VFIEGVVTDALDRLMREGYDYDDIYLMVEDEFQTVAQAYTAHLHHAEYKRLVKQARKAPAKALPEPTSAMSNEAKKRLKSAALEKKQKSALRQLLGPTATEEEEEEKVVDLWSGTSLAPLMATGNQQKTSLIGLERMSSSTKAGKGFTRIESKSRLDSKHDNAADWTLGCRLAKSRRSQTPETDISSSKTGRHGTEVQAMNQGSPLHKTKGPYKRQISGLAGTGDETRLLEDADIHKVRPTPRPIGSTFLKRRSEKEREDQEKKSRLEQVPTFFF